MAKAPKNCPKELVGFIQDGIELSDVVFHNNIAPFGGNLEPEQRFHKKSMKPSRQCNMWLTLCGVVMERKGLYRGVPEAHVKYWEPILGKPEGVETAPANSGKTE